MPETQQFRSIRSRLRDRLLLRQKPRSPWGTLPKNAFGTPPARAIVVHQPGKVGSSSLHQSLRESLPVPVYQTHSMHTSAPGFGPDEVSEADEERAPLVHLKKSKRFLRLFYYRGLPYGVVTLVRDPVARNVSAFFQNIEEHPHLCDFDNPPPIETYQQTFLDTFDHDFAERWFDYHFQQPFGVDFYDRPFDPEKGSAMFADGKHTFLIMQAELDDEQEEAAVRAWLNFDAFTMCVRANAGEEKPYAEIYRAFKKRPLPKAYLDRMYTGRIATHFYTPEQIARFRSKWEQNETQPA